MIFKKNRLAIALLALGGIAVSSTVAAGSATGAFKVNITILSACTVSAAVGTNDINFGSVNANPTANLDQAEATPITVACSNTTPYVIDLTPASTNSTTGAGNMINGSVNVAYQLRQATGASAAVWGNTGTVTGGVVTQGNGVQGVGTGLANPASYTVYATVASTDFAPNTYTDTVNVTVNY